MPEQGKRLLKLAFEFIGALNLDEAVRTIERR